jgi:hypothetical protein
MSSQSILALEHSSLEVSSRFSSIIGQPYLANLQWAWGNESETDPLSRAGDQLWEEGIYHHPN